MESRESILLGIVAVLGIYLLTRPKVDKSPYGPPQKTIPIKQPAVSIPEQPIITEHLPPQKKPPVNRLNPH